MRMKLAILLIVPAAMLIATQKPDPSPQNVWNGIYTADQARRGQAEFEKSCTACHENDVTEDPAARFKEEPFIKRWRDYDVESMFTFIKETMPRRKPRSLPDDVYQDIITHLLQLNNFPTGTQELMLESM